MRGARIPPRATAIEGTFPGTSPVQVDGEADGVLYLVMELIEGTPLSELIKGEGLAYQTVMRYASQITGALMMKRSAIFSTVLGIL